MRTVALSRSLIGLSLSLPAMPAMSQDVEQAPSRPTMPWSFSVSSSYEARFAADLDAGGEVEGSAFNFILGAEKMLSQQDMLSVSFAYNISSYDFMGATALGGDPWQDIHSASLSARYTHVYDVEWAGFAGAVVQSSRESGADWGDGLTSGAYVGAQKKFNDRFSMALGLGLSSQLEESARVFPVISLTWTINDQWRFASPRLPDPFGRTGVELVCEVGNGWEAAIGAAYEFRRFRLDDAGIAPGGVGETTAIPLWLRLSYRTSDHVAVDLFGGMGMGSTMTLDSAAGVELGTDDGGSGAFFGASARITF